MLRRNVSLSPKSLGLHEAIFTKFHNAKNAGCRFFLYPFGYFVLKKRFALRILPNYFSTFNILTRSPKICTYLFIIIYLLTYLLFAFI